jgi:hypothetical protein
MADKTYVVKAACAVVYNADRTAAVTVARGGAVPQDVDPEHLKVLLERGLIEEGDAGGGLDVDPDAAPPFPVPEEEPKARKAAAAKAD